MNRAWPAKGAGGGLASMIPEGMRAVAMRVNEVVGVAGFVTPGMRVDVLISGTPGATNTSAALGVQTKTMLQNMEVLSAGQDFKKDAEGKPIAVQVVNLLVTPEQAEMLSLASTQTTIQLVLRNPLDHNGGEDSGHGGGAALQRRQSASRCAACEPSGRPSAAPPANGGGESRAESDRPSISDPPFVMQIHLRASSEDRSHISGPNADVRASNGEAK